MEQLPLGAMDELQVPTPPLAGATVTGAAQLDPEPAGVMTRVNVPTSMVLVTTMVVAVVVDSPLSVDSDAEASMLLDPPLMVYVQLPSAKVTFSARKGTAEGVQLMA